MRNTIQFDFLHPMTTANGILSKRVLSISSAGQWEHWLFPVLFWESQEPPWQITGLGSIILLTLGYLFNNIWFLGVTLLTYAEYWYSNVFLYFYVLLIIIPCIPSIFYGFLIHHYFLLTLPALGNLSSMQWKLPSCL